MVKKCLKKDQEINKKLKMKRKPFPHPTKKLKHATW